MTCYRCSHIGTVHRHLPDKVHLRRFLHISETHCSDCTECRKGRGDV